METSGKYQVMPPLTEEEYSALKADIADNGVIVPVLIDADGVIIEGHYRVQAYHELLDEGHDVPVYPTQTSDLTTDAEKRDLAWRLNMQRRHLSSEQKREAIARKLKESPEWAAARIAKLLGVDDKTVRLMRVMLEGSKKIPKVEKVVGADGKEYPRELEKPPPKPEKTPRELEKESLEKKLRDKGVNTKAAKILAQAVTLPRDEPGQDAITRERVEGPLRWESDHGAVPAEPREPTANETKVRSDEERELLARLQSGETVVVDMLSSLQADYRAGRLDAQGEERFEAIVLELARLYKTR